MILLQTITITTAFFRISLFCIFFLSFTQPISCPFSLIALSIPNTFESIFNRYALGDTEADIMHSGYTATTITGADTVRHPIKVSLVQSAGSIVRMTVLISKVTQNEYEHMQRELHTRTELQFGRFFFLSINFISIHLSYRFMKHIDFSLLFWLNTKPMCCLLFSAFATFYCTYQSSMRIFFLSPSVGIAALLRRSCGWQ